MKSRTRHRGQRGISFLEVMAVVVILGIIAAIALPRFGDSTAAAKTATCRINTGNIEVQAALWYRNKGTWPASDLSDIFADTSYFPDGATSCPLDGSTYTFDAATEEVVGHAH